MHRNHVAQANWNLWHPFSRAFSASLIGAFDLKTALCNSQQCASPSEGEGVRFTLHREAGLPGHLPVLPSRNASRSFSSAGVSASWKLAGIREVSVSRRSFTSALGTRASWPLASA